MREEARNRMMVFGLLACCTALFFGYEVGVFNSFFQAFVERVFGITDVERQLQMKGTVSFLFLFGGTLCSLTGGFLYGRIGFYNTLISICLAGIATCIMLVFRSMFLIYLARFIAGYFSCMSGLVPSLLIKRHLPEKDANSILPMLYIFITAGILLAYWVAVPNNVGNWGFVLLFPLLFLVPLTVILLTYFPEASLEFPGAEDRPQPPAELTTSGSLVKTQSDEPLLEGNETPAAELTLPDMFGPEYSRQMYFAIFLNVANQLTGINFLIYYSTDIFQKVGLPNPPLLTVINGLANVAGGVFLSFYLKRFIKRDVMLVGCAGQTVFMFMVVLGLWWLSGVLVLIGCYGFTFFFAISLGGELGPYVVDFVPPAGFAMTGLSQWVLACFIGKFAINVMDSLGQMLCFSILGLIAALATVVMWGFGVVTEGKSPAQIKREFMNKRFGG